MDKQTMKNKIVIPFIAIVVISLAVVVGILYTSQPKVAYVNLNKVYNDFEMKKELEKKLTTVQDFRKKTLDSLELGLNIMSRTLQNFDQSGNKKGIEERMPEFQQRREEYFAKQKSFEEDNAAMTGQYTEQIWKQINQYVKDYGKEKGYTYVLGADGTGAVMYAEEKNEITEEVIGYINQRYKGGVK